MKVGFFPLDRQLQLANHSWSPETIKQAIRLGVEIPSYRRAAESFQELTKIPLSKSSLRELTIEYGGYLVEVQEEEAEATVQVPGRDEDMEVVWRNIPEPDSEVMAVCLDGALINIREEGWKEIKVATISAVEREVQLERDEEKEVRLSQHSYRAGLWEAKEFAKHHCSDAHRRTRVAVFLLWRSWRSTLLTFGPARLGDSPNLALAALGRTGPHIPSGLPMGVDRKVIDLISSLPPQPISIKLSPIV